MLEARTRVEVAPEVQGRPRVLGRQLDRLGQRAQLVEVGQLLVTLILMVLLVLVDCCPPSAHLQVVRILRVALP